MLGSGVARFTCLYVNAGEAQIMTSNILQFPQNDNHIPENPFAKPPAAFPIVEFSKTFRALLEAAIEHERQTDTPKTLDALGAVAVLLRTQGEGEG